MNQSNLETLGWDPWFEEQAQLRCDPEGAVARVAAVDRDQLLLLNEKGAFRAKLSGRKLGRRGIVAYIAENSSLTRVSPQRCLPGARGLVFYDDQSSLILLIRALESRGSDFTRSFEADIPFRSGPGQHLARVATGITDT